MPGFMENFRQGRDEAFRLGREARAARGAPRLSHGLATRDFRCSLPVPVRPTLTISADARGQFYLTANADGAVFRLLADTGASGLVFRKEDAAPLGLNLARMDFSQTGAPPTARFP